MTSLHLDSVHKRFGPTVALGELDLDVGSGELVSLLGPSGCGKTTALRIVAGFERPDRGRVVAGDADITDQPAAKRDMGMVFQAYSLFPHLTAAENVAFGLRLRRQRATVRQARVAEMLELVGLGDRADNFPHQLSGGQQQRVALARALAIRPEILLLDEPLSALDARVRLQLRNEIRRIQVELGTTTVFVTHDQEEALAISDRVGVMSAGRLEQLAPPATVYERPASAFVARFVGRTNELAGDVVGPGAVRVDDRVVSGIDTRDRSSGTPVRVLVRPEHLSLCPSIDDAHLRGRIVAQSFLGAQTETTVALAGPAPRQVVVQHPSIEVETWPAGSDVGLRFDPGRVVLDGAPASTAVDAPDAA